MDVSVVIPTHDRRERVMAAVESALGQAMPPREVIVVDDASTDGTPEAVAARFSQEPRVRLVALPSNGGACRARNAGIAEARGEWVAFLDSDDRWLPGKLAAQAAAVAASPGAVAAFTGLRAEADGKFLYDLLPPEGFVNDDLQVENVLLSTSCAVVRRDVLARTGGFDPDLPSCQDWDLYLRVVAAGPVALVREPLVAFDDGSHVRISRDIGKVLRGHEIIFERIYAGLADRRRLAHLRRVHRFWVAEALAYQGGRPAGGLALGTARFLSSPSRETWPRYLNLARFAAWRALRAARRALGAVRPASAPA